MRKPRTVSESPARPRIMVVDDSDGLRTLLADALEAADFDVDTAEDGRRAVTLLESGAAPDAIVLDVIMPGDDGLTTLEKIRQLDEDVPVVMLSSVSEPRTVVDALRLGATDYVEKPAPPGHLERLLGDLTRRPEDDIAPPSDEPFWESPALSQIRGLLEQIASTDVTVLIQGESGTGKEVVARELHAISPRRDQPFVKVNCAALPGELLESELFGYEAGAFTGAVRRKPGKFEQAGRGTIFLDEIGEMSAALQAKLLHVLQDGTFSHLGGNEELAAEARVVTATHRQLEDMVREGTFREDLFFRLNVVNVRIPPLRERRDEIDSLVDVFLARFSARYDKPRRELSKQLVSLFDRHPFPGNVRELENLIKRIVVLESEESVIQDLLARASRPSGGGISELDRVLEELEATAGEVPLKEVGRRAALAAEREAIQRALYQTDWNRRRAAELLEVSYKTLLSKIRDCEIEPEIETQL